jgi:TRAP-type C4-dicarboxylate transport system permease small subunit
MAEQKDIGNTGAIPRFADAPLGAALGAVANTASAIGTIWIGALMALIVADVIGRNFLNAPITGVAEIAGRSVVAIVFLQISAAVMQGKLTRADFLIRRIRRGSPASAQVLETCFAIIGAMVFAAIVWSSWPKMVGAWTGSEFFGVQGVFTIPTFPFRAITVIGSALAMLACLYQLARGLRARRGDAS